MAKKRKQPATQSSTLHDFFGKPTQSTGQQGTRTPANKKPKLKLGPPEPALSKHKKTSTPFKVAEGDIIVIDDDDDDDEMEVTVGTPTPTPRTPVPSSSKAEAEGSAGTRSSSRTVCIPIVVT